jgi:hypothetical protein
MSAENETKPPTASAPAVASSALLCLSVRQPWAWLICNVGKDIENRDWPTRFRGRVLIHAGKTMARADYEACCIFIASMPGTWRLPAYDILRTQCGGIVGETEIVGCINGNDAASNSPWFTGEYGFMLRNSKPLPFEPCKGALGFFRANRHNAAGELQSPPNNQK